VEIKNENLFYFKNNSHTCIGCKKREFLAVLEDVPCLLEREGLEAAKKLLELVLARFGVDMLVRLGVEVSLEVLPALALLNSNTKYK